MHVFSRSIGVILTGAVLTIAGTEARAADLSGSWSGSWQSCTTGHKGPLKATFCKIDDTHYSVRFHGRFFIVIPFRYSVTLEVVKQEGDKVYLSGDSYLGRLMGSFTYAAEATPTDFVASYTSCKDQGQFVLSRCCGR